MKELTDKELVAALRRDMAETGSLRCLGCGHEHNCGTSGCAILRKAAERIDALTGAVTMGDDLIRRSALAAEIQSMGITISGEDIFRKEAKDCVLAAINAQPSIATVSSSDVKKCAIVHSSCSTARAK